MKSPIGFQGYDMDSDVLKVVMAWIGIVFVTCILTLLILSSDQIY